MIEHLTSLTREGYGVRLEPLSLEHADQVVGKVDPGLFRYFPSGGPSLPTRDSWRAFFHDLMTMTNAASYAIVDETTREIRGGTSYLDVRETHKGLEIGCSWVMPDFQRTHVNPAAKLLMLITAFDELEFNRVQLKCDNRNEQSKANILKLGAKFEGILRQHIIMHDGFVRDTAMFSILHPEWPEVRERLLARLT